MAAETVTMSLVAFLSNQLLNPMNHNLPFSMQPTSTEGIDLASQPESWKSRQDLF